MKRRVYTVCRLLVHWSMGAAMGSIFATDQWNRWTTAFTIIYFVAQTVAIPVNPYKRK